MAEPYCPLLNPPTCPLMSTWEGRDGFHKILHSCAAFGELETSPDQSAHFEALRLWTRSLERAASAILPRGSAKSKRKAVVNAEHPATPRPSEMNSSKPSPLIVLIGEIRRRRDTVVTVVRL